ncbi:hypothetical protein TanjilG_16494 [Lupinus angustifolius]|uniref:Uncharacterized protein n=1 Tax=Lupinus angustifolius TaxID=3871 RepID=A0A1J7IEQ9_LUPAN|nr:PREDICTED: uncharacterized protein LOC109344844 [Lupinus angustifolius]OIW13385.1 hypothetical protein TanjilG_16494 [Lupinus angustifolius]
MHKALNKFWKRNSTGYGRLYGSRRRRRMDTVELGGGTCTTTNTRRRRWRIKISRKIKIPKIPSPKKMVLWLRDGYVNMMMSLANSKVVSMSSPATSHGGFGRGLPPKEYDDKMLVQMYKSLMAAQGVVVPRQEDCPR